MKKPYEPRYMQKEGLAIRQIVLDQTEWVTVWGYLLDGEEPVKTDFLMEFETLNKLLRYNADAGDEVQMLIVDRLEEGIGDPVVVDVEAFFGMPAVLDQVPLKVYHPQDQVKSGRWEEDHRCLFVDEIIVPKPVDAKAGLYRRNFRKCVRLLAKSYQLYLGYLELEFDETAAMEKAGLQDEVKFKMAYYAWKTEPGATLH